MSEPAQQPYHAPDSEVLDQTEVLSPEVSEDEKSPTNPLKKFLHFPKFNFSGKTKTWQKVLIVFVLILLLLTSVGGVLAFYTYSVAMNMKTQAMEAKTIGQTAYDQFKAQNLPATREQLLKLQDSLVGIKASYSKLSFYRYIPIANTYYNDGWHGLKAAEAGMSAGMQSLDAITPYADVLGFTGEGTFTGGTAEDRLKVILDTIDKIKPVLDQIAGDLKVMDDELAAIELKHYPESIRGTAVRPRLVQVQQLSKGAVEALTQYRPIIEQLPEIAGAKGARKKYLVLFTNDGELRPTGGFLTAYSVIFIENGKVTPDKSDDIYELDKKYAKRLPIPEQLGRYLTTEKYWHLRDMNIYPDFRESMETFLSHYKEVKGEPQDIDGIIAVDTHVLTDLLKTLGPVEVPGYGMYSAEPGGKDLPQVVYALSEIITKPTPYMREDRKGILGPMMRAVLTKAYGAPKQQWPDLFSKGIELMQARHIQMYFLDENAQLAAEAINAAGRMTIPEESDFLAVVNANLGGAKSNFFINSEMEQVVEAPENGQLKKTLTMTYKNNRKGDNCNLEAGQLCLNATNRDWTRLYVPKGAQLVEAQGFTQDARVYDEGDFTVIEGFFLLEPMSQAKLKVTYTIPYSDAKTYRLRLWKQGGIDTVPVLMEVTGGQEKLELNKDLQYQTDF